MRLLLDTHSVLWALADVGKLPPRLGEILRDQENDCYVSAASAWEIAIKAALGKFTLPPEDFGDAVRRSGFEELPVHITHGLRVRALPHHHRDPFDRLLIAQALVEGLTIVSRDRIFARYDVPILWA